MSFAKKLDIFLNDNRKNEADASENERAASFYSLPDLKDEPIFIRFILQ